MNQTLRDVMKELECNFYYIVELDVNLDAEDCAEYYTSAEDIDPELLDCEVVSYEYVSTDFAVIYLNVETYDDADDVEDLMVEDLINSVREIAVAMEEPLEMTIKTYPELKMFSINIEGVPVYFPYEVARLCSMPARLSLVKRG